MVTMASSASSNIVSATLLSSDTSSPNPPKKASENRRSNKPIMEKRRRARINNSLNDLKALILDAMRKDPSRHSKLEKADILEMAVKHLRSLHKHQSAMQNDLDKYRAGFSECASEVERYSGLEVSVRRRLLQHLNNYLSSANVASSQPLTPSNEHAVTAGHLPSQQQILNVQSVNAAALNGFLFSANANAAGVQLVPTRLPNGELALILPSVSTSNNIQQRLAMSPTPSSSSCSTPPLASMINHSRSTSMDSVISNNSPIGFDRLSVNIPPSSSSTEDICHSPGSVQSTYSSPRSPAYNPYDRLYHSPKPLSLVVREDEKECWRPW